MMATDALVAPLLSVDLFHGLQPSQLAAIARSAERMLFRPGEEIAVSGGAADAALLIVAGAAEWQGDERAKMVAHAEPIEIGSLIGEMAMFIDYVYGATIIATGSVKCLRLTRVMMHDLMLEDAELARHLTAKIAQRLTRVADDLRAIDRDLEVSMPDFGRIALESGAARAVQVH